MATELASNHDIAQRAILAHGLSYEEFLGWSGESQHVEWVNGEVIAMSPVSYRHQLVSGFLIASIGQYARSKQLGKVLFDPFQMKVSPDAAGRAPDILFVANKNSDRIKPNYLDGPADLVVEIISPGSRVVDRGEKFYEYEAGGVSEYWLLDPERKQAEWYQRGDDGFYHAVAASQGVYHSRALPGLWIREDWLWQESLPDPLDVLREWKLI